MTMWICFPLADDPRAIGRRSTSCGFYPIGGTLDRASPCVNHLPSHVPRRITREEDYYTGGIVGLIDFRYSRRYGPFASQWVGYPPCIRCSGIDRINGDTEWRQLNA